MNDFTKDELQSLAYGLECSGMPNSDLRKKVLSLIDNYCEHNFQSQCESCAVEECDKCKIVRWMPIYE